MSSKGSKMRETPSAANDADIDKTAMRRLIERMLANVQRGDVSIEHGADWVMGFIKGLQGATMTTDMSQRIADRGKWEFSDLFDHEHIGADEVGNCVESFYEWLIDIEVGMGDESH